VQQNSEKTDKTTQTNSRKRKESRVKRKGEGGGKVKHRLKKWQVVVQGVDKKKLEALWGGKRGGGKRCNLEEIERKKDKNRVVLMEEKRN